MNKTIKEFSVIELKATAYDNLAQIESCQANIRAINQELSSRKETPVESVAESVEESVEEVKEVSE